ncbi:MAG: glycoside hydrolase family 3 N-terminal domain-containing protein [Bellilinea sp.]|jgi:beta-N-acetylhexosaminidase
MIARRIARLFIRLILMISVMLMQTVSLLGVQPAQAARHPQSDDLAQQVNRIMAQMTPEQKVGQLFLVTFNGTDVGRDSQIYNLITTYRVGGIVLRADNDNFDVAGNTVPKAAEMIRALQNQVWENAQTTITSAEGSVSSPYVPLFIGISQEGDLYPNDQILNGMTSLPSLMAIGATWQPNLAEAVGTVMGRELRAIGFNLYFGPSLDVLEVVSDAGTKLGTRAFGGDPFWVGEMGKAYVRGLHLGSRDQMAVIAKHFPGRGASDRMPEEEVATVRKSLDGLKQVELAPFFATMTADPETKSQIDGVLVSHIRYQGLQENIREITPPVSLDGEAMRQVLTIEPIASWYQGGGIIISDNLGSNAVRRFYDPSGQTFDGRSVARNAFLAGNDLLYLNNFVEPADADAFTSMVRVLESFSQKYREDTAFAERVDQSVRRILTLKLKLYGDFHIDRVIPAASLLNEVGRSQSVVLEVARQSATLLSPSPAELNISIPRPPENRDQIVFFTDVVNARQCSTCPDQAILSVDSLKNAVIRLYGPAAGGSIIQGYLSSYTFLDLNTFLNSPEGLAAVGVNLAEAEWVVFVISDETSNRPESRALKRLLSEKPELLRNKRVIVFALGAPYYLDATDIAKLTAYYGLFSKTPAYIDTAARLLFQEQTANGASPVSIPGVGYDIIRITSPDPDQIIPLYFDYPEPEPGDGTNTPQPTATPEFRIGDMVPFRTGVIIDHNGNPVPNGTVARFIITVLGETGATQQVETVTDGGIARMSYRISALSNIDVRVISEPAVTSQIISINAANGQTNISTVVPTPEPTATVTPSPTPTLYPTPEIEEAAEATVSFHISDWLLMMIITLSAGAGIVWIGERRISLRWGFRWGLMAILGGLVAYNILASGWFVPINALYTAGKWGVVVVSLVGVLTGWLAGWIWQARLQRRKKPLRRS